MPLPRATDQPTTKVGLRWTLRFNLAWIGVMVGFFGPLQILLPNKAAAIAPHDKEYTLALVTSLGAIFSMVMNPLWGALSDRTTSRFGRRLPWVVAGGVAGALSLVLEGVAQSVLLMVVAWCLVQSTLNASWAALSAVVPDQVPEQQRGTVAGWLGLAQLLGVLFAVGLATVVAGEAGFFASAVVLLLAMVPFVLARQDVRLVREELSAWSWREFASGFWINPRRHPDFGWAWLTRFLMNFGNSTVMVYLLYFLRDALHRPHPEADVIIIGAVNALGVGVAVVISGRLSDRTGRRKAFVTAAGLVMALASALLAGVQSWTIVLAAAFIMGLGFGIYTSVDFALITQVLPAATARGKDMGVLNIANALPQVVAPAIGAAVITSLGGYHGLFAVSGAMGILGAGLVRFIRTVE
ncbi:MAG TPA: MFS transporter [Segeticoccus sp.]|uniref:MFS transporter n=1 Tax=Segeticoccus sp. TaxID=2706531 RepID=UPI002D7FD721|nr:MFS transporter [Segeticoccus sp.]HET8601249.1 MFS transporter [Segeticoccus sp.]